MEKTRLVRDILMHKRGFPPPVIKLESMDRHKCYDQRQRQVSFLFHYPAVNLLRNTAIFHWGGDISKLLPFQRLQLKKELVEFLGKRNGFLW